MQDGSDGLSVALSIAAAAGLGALAFTEVGILLLSFSQAHLIRMMHSFLLTIKALTDWNSILVG